MPHQYHSVDPDQYNNWWVERNTYFRTTDVRIYEPEQVQIDNMILFAQFFLYYDWTPNCIAGMLGNIMVESGVNPWLFEHSSVWWDEPANIMSDSGGMGLTQWTPCRKYYDWAVNVDGGDPADGNEMCTRILYESSNNLQWSLDNYGHHTWHDFITSTESPEILARVFLWAYERPANPDVAQRQANARWVYDNVLFGAATQLSAEMIVLLAKKKKRKGGLIKRWLKM